MMAARSRTGLGLSWRFRALLRAFIGEEMGRRALVVEAVVIVSRAALWLPELV